MEALNEAAESTAVAQWSVSTGIRPLPTDAQRADSGTMQRMMSGDLEGIATDPGRTINVFGIGDGVDELARAKSLARKFACKKSQAVAAAIVVIAQHQQQYQLTLSPGATGGAKKLREKLLELVDQGLTDPASGGAGQVQALLKGRRVRRLGAGRSKPAYEATSTALAKVGEKVDPPSVGRMLRLVRARRRSSR